MASDEKSASRESLQKAAKVERYGKTQKADARKIEANLYEATGRVQTETLQRKEQF